MINFKMKPKPLKNKQAQSNCLLRILSGVKSQSFTLILSSLCCHLSWFFVLLQRVISVCFSIAETPAFTTNLINLLRFSNKTRKSLIGLNEMHLKGNKRV